jgi:hypothetical protein
MADSPNTRTLPEIHPSRRAALAGIAGTLALATGVAGTVAIRSAHADDNPDAELITLCNGFCIAWKTWDVMGERDVPEKEFTAFHEDVVIPSYNALQAIRPKTLMGIIAKAQAVLLYEYDYPEDADSNEQGHWYVQQLARLELVS